MTKDPIQRLRDYGTDAWVYGDLGSIADEIEAQYMRLPVDADGLPIKPGDMMTDGEVCAVSADSYFTRHGHTPTEMEPGFSHHVKPDTMEKLLEEFQHDTLSAQGEYAGEVIEADCFRRELRTLTEDYAERIRKAVEG